MLHRSRLIVGAAAVIRHSQTHPGKHSWIMKLLATMPVKSDAQYFRLARDCGDQATIPSSSPSVYRMPTRSTL